MHVVVHVDGGSRGNPGPAAAAPSSHEPDRASVLDEATETLGEATNNVAEYRGLLLGLERARALGATEVEVINDSELVARQISGAYKVKHAGHAPALRARRWPRCAASRAGRCARSRARRTPPPTRSSTRRSTLAERGLSIRDAQIPSWWLVPWVRALLAGRSKGVRIYRTGHEWPIRGIVGEGSIDQLRGLLDVARAARSGSD